MSKYDTSSIREAIIEHCQRSIEDENLARRGHVDMIKKIRSVRDDELRKLEAMRKKAQAFDEYHEGVKKMIEQDTPVTLAMAKVHDDFEGR